MIAGSEVGDIITILHMMKLELREVSNFLGHTAKNR